MDAALPAELTAIVIQGKGGVVGDGTDQPFKIAEDWRRFKALTMGSVLIVGRPTFEAIGRPLSGRDIFVLTRDPDFAADGVQVFTDPDQALQAARGSGKPVFIGGGGQIWRHYWDQLTRLEVTEVDADAPGDVTFPVIDRNQWQLVAADPREGYAFHTWERVT